MRDLDPTTTTDLPWTGQDPAPAGNRAARRAESKGQVDKNPAHAPRTLGHGGQATRTNHSSFAFRRV